MQLSEALAQVISEAINTFRPFGEKDGEPVLVKAAQNGQEYSTTGNMNGFVEGTTPDGKKFQDRITVCVNRWYEKPGDPGRINTQVIRQAAKNPDKLSADDKAKALAEAQKLVERLSA